MKLDGLAEHLIDTTSLNCLTLKDVIELEAPTDARGERIKTALLKACETFSAARDDYWTMQRDVKLEANKKAP